MMDALKSYIEQLAFRQVSEEEFAQGEGWTLASGQRSRFYFNLKPVMLFPVGMIALRERLVRTAPCSPDRIFAVGGPEVGAIPLVCGIIAHHGITGFYVRKKPKPHGNLALIEGFSPEQDVEGREVWLVEDVVTSGESLLRCVRTCRDAGMVVLGTSSVIDRESGATQLLADAGVAHRSVFRFSEFLESKGLRQS